MYKDRDPRRIDLHHLNGLSKEHPYITDTEHPAYEGFWGGIASGTTEIPSDLTPAELSLLLSIPTVRNDT